MKLGALIVDHSEMQLVWRVDVFDKLTAELEAWKAARRRAAVEPRWGWQPLGLNDESWPEDPEFLTWLFGNAESFYCGNGLPYNFRVEEIILGEPMFGHWSDD